MYRYSWDMELRTHKQTHNKYISARTYQLIVPNCTSYLISSITCIYRCNGYIKKVLVTFKQGEVTFYSAYYTAISMDVCQRQWTFKILKPFVYCNVTSRVLKIILHDYLWGYYKNWRWWWLGEVKSDLKFARKLLMSLFSTKYFFNLT